MREWCKKNEKYEILSMSVSERQTVIEEFLTTNIAPGIHQGVHDDVRKSLVRHPLPKA